MEAQPMIGQAQLQEVVIACVNNVLSERDDNIDLEVDEKTFLLGPEAVLDSLGLVTVLVDLEQSLEDEFGFSLTIADERAMSQDKSPFRTVQSLTDYIHRLILETGQDG